MNLTHRNLALLSGLTRVTVTKALSRFRDGGQLFKLGEDELLATTGKKRVERQG
jgi:CRP-like cAMP-binding protein